MAVKNMAASVLVRLKNQSKKELSICLRNLIQDRRGILIFC